MAGCQTWWPPVCRSLGLPAGLVLVVSFADNAQLQPGSGRRVLTRTDGRPGERGEKRENVNFGRICKSKMPACCTGADGLRICDVLVVQRGARRQGLRVQCWALNCPLEPHRQGFASPGGAHGPVEHQKTSLTDGTGFWSTKASVLRSYISIMLLPSLGRG